ncbi:FAD-binding oxidoreductase [Nitriliruptor alkaliphilus]|uniref:FAD-binding oxidoreductase n=1 Tax=Nitriliruptor alkaliphilus TaxID=427918 RepID=UPI000696FA67|nr:FAD-binding oxidoreductase [Nitriliruptor alkaliphilus]
MSQTLPATRAVLDDLRRAVRGEVIAPDDPRYADARQVYYGGFDRRPAALVRPVDAGDVAAAVSLARELDLDLAVRSGGHSLAGHGTVEAGVVLDLSSLDDLELDVESRTAWVGAGVTAGAYTEAAGVHGLATGFGDAGTVGIGGLTVGGGTGFLSRKHGLTIDQLLAAEVVTADGRIQLVDEVHEPDLFWGIRGGGGNLGVVTRLRFVLHDVSELTGGMLVLPATAAVLAGVVATADAAPEELTLLANTMVAPPMPFLPEEVHGQLVVVILAVHVGPAAAGQEALAPLRRLATPLVDELAPMAYADLFVEPPGVEDFHPVVVTRTMFRETFGVAEAEVAIDGLLAATTPMAAVQLRVLGGAVARVRDDATAYAHRQRRLMVNVAALYEDPIDGATATVWAEDLAARLREAGVDGAYVNFLGDEGPARVREAYPGDTWDRLARLKARYDPTNLFRHNQNVPPG